jgi:hypothetical protein
MEHAPSLCLIQIIEIQLAACKKEIDDLAREAMSPSTTGARRAEALILRAQLQTRSVFLSRELQRLRSDLTGTDCPDNAVDRKAIGLEPLHKPPRSVGIHGAIGLYPSRSADL